MPVIRFLREGREVECYPGENLREVALREGIELYGLKGRLGNCGGCGQCITCFVDVQGCQDDALSPPTSVEIQKLKRRPQSWRLACQALVQRSLVVLTRPQSGLADGRDAWSQALGQPLPPGPQVWPDAPAEPTAVETSDEGLGAQATATTDEGPPEDATGQ
jgi:ferredoxin